MKILITGTNSINKGAELMLFAVIKQIEKVYPDAEIFLPYTGFPDGIAHIRTTCKLQQLPGLWFYKWYKKLKIDCLFRRLHLSQPVFSEQYPIIGIDLVLDAGGYQFADSFWTCRDWNERWIKFLCSMKENGSKIVFLPQAFGPFSKHTWDNVIQVIGEKANLIFAREKISQQSFLDLYGEPCRNLYVAPDFTCLLKGASPPNLSHLRGGIAIIPNIQMTLSSSNSRIQYINFMTKIISNIREYSHREIFFLNHEGKRDELLCQEINERFVIKMPIISGLDAISIKGIISDCFLVISSRFHGVASALNSGVPCMATSWSHKYDLLYGDYGLNQHILDINQLANDNQLLKELLTEEGNARERNTLRDKIPDIIKNSQMMWKEIWGTVHP